MGNFLLIVLGGIFLYSFAIYCWHRLLGKKLDFKNYKFYLAVLIASIVGTSIDFFAPSSLKIILLICMMIIINYTFFCKNMVSCISAVFILEFLVMISETIIVLLMAIIFNGNVTLWEDNVLMIFAINIIVCLLGFLLLLTPIPYKLYNLLMRLFTNIRRNILIVVVLMTVFIASLFMVMSWMDLPIYVIVTLNTIFIVVYVFIMIKLFSTEANFKAVRSKYETSLSSLKEYEDIMNKYKIDNHENKNQLLTIRNMIKSKDKNVIKYIEKLVNDKINDNETIFYKTSKIPEGGLRATIYSKLCKMDELKLPYVLDISNDVRTVDLIKMGEDVTLDVCKIIGVFLDNAIEEAIKIKDKNITIELFIMDNLLYIDISNNYEGKLAVDKMDAEKYTTKGKNRGYGLALVKKIIERNKYLENEKKINHNRFKQRLIIKM